MNTTGSPARMVGALCAAIVIVWTSVGCGKTSQSKASADDAAILKALVESVCQERATGYFEAISDIPAVVSRQFEIPGDWAIPANVSDQLMQSRQSLVRWQSVSGCPYIKIIDGKRAESLIAQDKHVPQGWDGLRAAYPGLIGLSAVSRPIYTQKRDRAYAVMQGRIEYFSDFGALYEFVYSNDAWRISRSKYLWRNSF